MINNKSQKHNSDLDYGAWDSLIDNPNLRSKRVAETNIIPKTVNKNTKVLPTNNLDQTKNLAQSKTNNFKPVDNIKIDKNVNLSKNDKSKKTSSNFKKIPKFDLTAASFLNKDNSAKQIYVDILAKDDYDLILNFKKSWFCFIPFLGLILFIWVTNRMFRSFKLNISRTIFNNNGLNNIIVVGCVLVSMMFAVITTYLVCVFLLGLFNNLSGTSSIITFAVLLLVIVIVFLLLIDYSFVFLFLFYVHPKVKKIYKKDLSRALTKINWSNVNSILQVLDSD